MEETVNCIMVTSYFDSKLVGFGIAVAILVRVLNPKPMHRRGEPIPEPLEDISRIVLAIVALMALIGLFSK